MKQSKDFIFFHPPAILNGQEPILDADNAFSHQFVSIPVGCFTLANNLEKSGFNVGILNLGEKMLVKKDSEELKDIIKYYLEKYMPKIVGIDLHWWVHSAGSVETARLIKEINPKIITLLGGITSSYYAEEIMRDFSSIDYILTGECDESIVSFTKYICNNEMDLNCISGLVYGDNGDIKRNVKVPPQNLDKLDITRYDLLLEPTIVNVNRAIIPITRGCIRDCNYCGASNESFFKIMGRKPMCFLKPEVIVDLIVKNNLKNKKHIYLYGDIQDGGSSFTNEFFKLLQEKDIEGIHLVIEFFDPPSKDIVEKWLEIISSKKITLEATISPDSGNYLVRKKIGRNYTNDQLVNSAKYLYERNIPLSVYFMLGCPDDSDETISETLKLSDDILSLYSKYFTYESVRHEIIGYEFMQIPDLGSEVYSNPEKYNIKINFNSFISLVDNIKNATHWSQLIGFTTKHFNQTDFVKQYYRIKYSIYKMYYKYKIIDRNTYNNKINKFNNDKRIYNNIKGMNKMRFLIIESHPYKESFITSSATMIRKVLTDKGHPVENINLVDDCFNPVMSAEELKLWGEGKSKDKLVKKYQAMITKSDMLVIPFPVWWGNMPAILKGFWDKVFLPGWAFPLKGKKAVVITKGKKAVVITTMTMPSADFDKYFQNPIRGAFIKNTLERCGLEVCKHFEVEEIDSGREYAEEKMREIECFFIDAKW